MQSSVSRALSWAVEGKDEEFRAHTHLSPHTGSSRVFQKSQNFQNPKNTLNLLKSIPNLDFKNLKRQVKTRKRLFLATNNFQLNTGKCSKQYSRGQRRGEPNISWMVFASCPTLRRSLGWSPYLLRALPCGIEPARGRHVYRVQRLDSLETAFFLFLSCAASMSA